MKLTKQSWGYTLAPQPEVPREFWGLAVPEELTRRANEQGQLDASAVEYMILQKKRFL